MFLNYLKGFAEASASYSEQPEFETAHLENVVLHAMHLCKNRGLDEKLVFAIAMGHDLGRTHLKIHGKKHARASAKLMKRLMADSNFSTEEQGIICDAIEHHNEKDSIHEEYAELIKDADSMAHKDDGILSDDDRFEHLRILASECGQLAMTYAPVSDWIRAYREHVEILKSVYLNSEKRSDHPDEWVHEIRTETRKLRTMLALLSPSEQKVQKKLKKWALEMTEARFLHVASLKSERLSPKVSKKLTRLYKELEMKLDEKKVLKRMKMLNIQFGSEKIVSDALSGYEDLVMNATPKRMHKLRVKGKAFKYLTQLGLMEFSPQEMLDAIMRLHDLLGDYNDYMEMADYFKDSSYKNDAKKLLEEIQIEIFFIRKIILCCTTTKNVRYN
jgi:hypothetical protein